MAGSKGQGHTVINRAPGEASVITGGVVDTAEAIEQVAAEIREPGGEQPVQFKMVEKAVAACSLVDPDAPTTLIVPGNMTEVSALIRSAMKMVQSTQAAAGTDWPPPWPGRERSHCYNSPFWSGG